MQSVEARRHQELDQRETLIALHRSLHEILDVFTLDELRSFPAATWLAGVTDTRSSDAPGAGRQRFGDPPPDVDGSGWRRIAGTDPLPSAVDEVGARQ